MSDKERSGQPKEHEDAELLALLDENSAQTLKELSEQLAVTEMAVSKRLKAMGKIQIERKWMLYLLKDRDVERRLVMSELLL